MYNFIASHRSEPLDKLAFALSKRSDIDARYVLQQIEGWQRLRTKVPTWAAQDALQYPPRISLEQCSGEPAARYKASVAERICEDRDAFADLTGGLGVDFSFMASLFRRAVYVEHNAELVQLARHNFPLLGLETAEIFQMEAEEWLRRQQESFSLLYLDPARRDAVGRKTVALADCTPDVTLLLPRLFELAPRIMLKLSPLFDLTQAERQLGAVVEAHFVESGGECRELLLILAQKTMNSSEEIGNPCRIICRTDICDESSSLTGGQEGDFFSFTRAEEAAANPEYAVGLDDAEYLYEPSPAILSAGAFRLIATRYGLKKLSPQSHLYVSSQLLSIFPGRKYRILRHSTFSRSELSRFKAGVRAAGLTVRGFPASVRDLRKRLGINEGGTEQWFAATLADGIHRLIAAHRL